MYCHCGRLAQCISEIINSRFNTFCTDSTAKKYTLCCCFVHIVVIVFLFVTYRRFLTTYLFVHKVFFSVAVSRVFVIIAELLWIAFLILCGCCCHASTICVFQPISTRGGSLKFDWGKSGKKEEKSSSLSHTSQMSLYIFERIELRTQPNEVIQIPPFKTGVLSFFINQFVCAARVRARTKFILWHAKIDFNSATWTECIVLLLICVLFCFFFPICVTINGWWMGAQRFV